MGGTSRTVGDRVSPALRRAKGAFEQWRRTKRGREAIPDRLWALAVRAASELGVNRTSKALGLNHTALQAQVRRRANRTARDQQTVPQFVPLPLSTPRAEPECIIEAEDGQGRKLRLQLRGGSTADLVSLSRVLWETAP